MTGSNKKGPKKLGGQQPARAPQRPATRGRSIRLRLGLAAALTILGALAVGGVVLSSMFDAQVNRIAETDLSERSILLMSGLNPQTAEAAPPDTIGGDPRYLRPFSGYYWQIDIGDRSYRAQSLWDTVLPLDAAPAPGETRITTGPGPDGQLLMLHDRMLLLGPKQVPVRLTVALDRHSFTEAQNLFTRDLVPFLAILGGLLLIAALIQNVVGLRPFRRIRQEVSALGAGGQKRLGRDMPQEVAPLAEAIDALLDERDARIEKARQRAADLAHTLKTPLQALMGEAGRLRSAGQDEPARVIAGIVDTIRQRIDHELGRERIAGQGLSDPARIARGVADVLSRTARGAQIAIRVAVEPHPLQIDPQDLTEALGATAENAMRHAKSRIVLRSERGPDCYRLIVEDNGPGIPEAHLAHVTRRGVRLSDDPEGSGLGLSLVREIMAAHGGQLDLENHRGGLRVMLTLPLAATPRRADEAPATRRI